MLDCIDIELGETLSSLDSSDSLTLIYYGGYIDADMEAASNKKQYVAEFTDDGAHVELKRQLGAGRPRASSAQDDDDEYPPPPDTTEWTWFQRYSWLSEGQTVIIITIFFFSLILFADMKTVTGIVIPYGAFDADFGAAAPSGDKKRTH